MNLKPADLVALENSAADRDRAAGGPIDLMKFIAVFRRHLRVFAAIALLVFVMSVVVTSRATPEYTATAKLMLDREQRQVTDIEAVVSGMPTDSAAVDTEVEILKSRQLAERVVDALNLIADPEFNASLAAPEGLGAVVAGVKRVLGSAAPQARQTAMTEAELQAVKQRVVDSVLSRVQVRRLGVTYVIDLEFTSRDPAKAAQIANTYADRYLLEQLEGRFDATRQANEWLSERLTQLRGEVEQAEAAVERYRGANNLLSASGATLTEQEISQYNQQLAQVRATQAEEEARLRTAREQLARGSSGDDVGEALGSPVVQQLRSQRVAASGRLAEAERRYGPRHPSLLGAQREIADIDNAIQEEIQRIISNLVARVEVARQRTASMAGSLGQARGTLASNNAASVRLNELTRNAEAVRTLYESYLNRFKETSTQGGLEQSDARVVSRAKIPDAPSSPNVPVNLLIGMMAGLGLATVALVLLELLDAGLMTAEDVETRLGVAHLGLVPHLRSVAEPGERSIRPIDHILTRPLSAFAESIRGLRTSILYSQIGEKARVVAVTSALPGEGKTTTSVCIARSVAQSGGSVVVIDCDLRRRNLGLLLGLQPAAGLIEVLNGSATLEDVMVYDEASGAWFLPLADAGFTPKDVFGSDAMKSLLTQLRARFDLVILDTAPVLAVADTRVLAALADAVVVLARWRKTPDRAIDAALKLIEAAGGRVAGVALSQVDMNQQASFGYGDAGYYYRDYRKYYTARA